MKHEFIICGHSSLPGGSFIVPKNVTIIFFAKKDEQCIVPDNYVGLKSAISEMREMREDGHIYNGDEVCPNHYITFTPKTLDGISIIKNEVFSEFHINPFQQIFPFNESVDLHECCQQISKDEKQKNGPSAKSIIYCVFCRGSNPDSAYGELFKIVDSNVDDEKTLDDFLAGLSAEEVDDNVVGFGLKKKPKRKPKKTKQKRKPKKKKTKTKRNKSNNH
jgi:hypothetical protein